MHRPLAIAALTALYGCAGTIDNGAGVCGDGVVDPDETCDEGDILDGDGCSATCQSEPIPRVDVTVDKPTIETELMTTHRVTVSLSASDGFAGTVAITANIVDVNNLPLADWIVAFDQPSVDVPINGVAAVGATLTIPSVNTGLEGRVRFTAASSAGVGTFAADTVVNALNQVTLAITSDGNSCVLPTGTTTVKVGTRVRLVNDGAIDVWFHSDGSAYGVPPQNTGGPPTVPDGAYEAMVESADGSPFDWYCAQPLTNNGAQNPRILPIP